MQTVEPITHAAIEEAAQRIAGHVRETPLLWLEEGAFGLPVRLALKLELTQRSGSFKARGAFNLLLGRTVPEAGVVAASGGNFGLAIAYAARALGHRATIFTPRVTSAAKQASLRALGATLVVTGEYYADALLASQRFAAEQGGLLAHAYDQPEVVAGAGTCGRELEGQAPSVDTLLVAVGGGGLIGGIAAWYAGRVRIVSVESTQTPTMAAALGAGEPVDVDVGGVAADALGARRAGALGFEAARRWVERAVLVTDDAILDAKRRLWDETRVYCEPASAAPLAAILSGAYVPAAGERVGLVVCGGNVSVA